MTDLPHQKDLSNADKLRIHIRATFLTNKYRSQITTQLTADCLAGKVDDIFAWYPDKTGRPDRYHYPDDWFFCDEPYPLTGDILSLAQLSSPVFRSALRDLLESLKDDGHDVSACEIELSSLQHIICHFRRSADRLLAGVIDLRNGKYDQEGKNE